MRRRRLLLGALASLGAGLPASLRAQTTARSPRRVAVLAPSTRTREEATLKPFFDGMRKLGWIEGQTVVYDRAYADDISANLQRLAAELVARKPDVIFAPPSPAAVAARKATRTIPIVFATGTDPVGIGLVDSLARPGGNVTGLLSVDASLAPKLLQMLDEALPSAKRIGFLSDPNDPRTRIDREALAAPASALGLTVIVAPVTSPGELEPAIARLAEQKVDAIVTSTSLMFNLRGTLVQFATAKRIPVVGHREEVAEAGAIFSYGTSLRERLARSAEVVDKVLKGASPATIPVDQPTQFVLAVNLQAASRLGVKIPQSLLLRAERVIE